MENSTGQISRFYQTELLSTEECGVYLSNIEIFNISKEMGFDITLTTNEFILSELFKSASLENKTDELNKRLLVIFNDRLEEYQKLKQIYPNANSEVDNWILKCKNTIKKIEGAKVG